MQAYDVVIIGAGAVGAAIARELSRYTLRVLALDMRDDVGGDASKSNSSIICSGFDCPPDTLESTLCRAQRPMVDALARDLDIPFHPCGAIMPAVTREQADRLPAIYDDACRNHVYDVEYLSPEEMLALEPNLNPQVLGGLLIPRDGVIDPFLMVVAQAENAAENGVDFLLDCRAEDIIVENGRVRGVQTANGRVEARYVINAAGLFSDEIARMAGECDFVVKPRKGQFFILDKNTPCKVSRIVYPIPTPQSRGKLILPTVHGNMLVGPTAEDLDDKFDHGVTAQGLADVEAECRQLVPGINIGDAITQYAGLRPNRIPAGYHIGWGKNTKGYLGISGIRSTGVSTCLAVAKYVAHMLSEAEPNLTRKAGWVRTRRGIARFAEATPPEREALIRQDARYGRIVCRCETVTEAEIVQAIRRPVGARTLDAVKRRVRAGMGRCQGGFCMPRIVELIAKEIGIAPCAVRKNLEGSNLLAETTDERGRPDADMFL